MSPVIGRRDDHDRARELAARQIDEPLESRDARWLEAHLAACEACAAEAAAFEADRLLLGGLRNAPLVPPRDLWARTTAAIDAERGPGRPTGSPRRRSWIPLASLVPLAGLAVVAVLVGSSLLTGSPAAPSTADVAGSPAPFPTAIAMRPGQVAVVTRGADGGLQVLTAGVDEVCPLVAEGCAAAAPSFATSPLTGLAAGGSMDAIISPSRDRIVVVQRNTSGSDGVYVVAVRPPTGGGVATIPTSSPEPSGTAAASSGKPPADGSPATTPAGSPASASPSAAATPDSTTSPDRPTDEPAPSDRDSPTPAVSEPPDATPKTTPTPAPTVDVTPAPDGAIEIAKDVVVVGSIAEYDASGALFAFTARPADGSAGPDVYVWDTAETQARQVTGDHRSLFAGWDGRDLLVSRVEHGQPRTVAVNARTGEPRAGAGEAAWLPAISPDGSQAVWWEGDVEPDADGTTWTPTKGRLVIGPWPAGTGELQVLSRRAPAAWQVRWAPDGSAVAVWTADREGDGGALSLYAIDPDSGRVNLSKPLLRDEPALAGFSLDGGRLVYASADQGDGRGVWVFAWEGDSSGRVRLPGNAEITVIR